MKKVFAFLILLIPIAMIFIVNFSVNIITQSIDISVQEISLNKDVLVVNLNDSVSLEATIYPSGATNKEVTWSSSNEEVAVVDEHGRITLKGFGGCYITVTSLDSAKQSSCYLYVTDTTIHQIVPYSSSNKVNVGEKLKIDALTIPAEAETVPFSYEIVSGNEYATIDQDGMLLGVKPGSVSVRVYNSNLDVEGFISISVIQPVEKFILNEKPIVYANNSGYAISYEILPHDATNKNVDVSLSDNEIAKANGSYITFNKAGSVDVTVKTQDGGFSESFTLVFTDGYASQINIQEQAISLDYETNTTYQIKYETLPSNLYNTSITFESSNENVVSVDSFGLVSVEGGGNATITIKAKTNATEYIEKIISVYVSREASGIYVENDEIITANSIYQLSPSSLPEDSTNTKYFYELKTNVSIATISVNGSIQFNQSGSVGVRIYANADNSDVYKDITITYTNGLPIDATLLEEVVNLTYNDIYKLDFIYNPINTTRKEISVEIVSQTPNVENENVVEILEDNSIKAIGGGNAIIKVTIKGYELDIIKNFEINVKREAEKINIDLNLDFYNECYITAKDVVEFNGSVSPQDADNKNIEWSVSNLNIAEINNGKLYFRCEGEVELIATVDNVSNKVKVCYVGNTPLYVEFEQVETDLYVSSTVQESVSIVIKSILPSDLTNQNLLLSKFNEQNVANKEVVEINENIVTAKNGGTVTVSVAVNGFVYANINFNVVKEVEDVEINYQNAQVTKRKVTLNATPFPVDATINSISYEITENGSIAKISGDNLLFSDFGVVKIKAIVNNVIEKEFQIERVQDSLNTDGNTILLNANVNEYVELPINSLCSDYASYTLQIVSGAEFVQIINNEVYASSIGKAVVQIDYFDSENDITDTYLFDIEIVQLVQDINLVNFDFYNGVYVTAIQSNELNFEVLPSNATNIGFSITSCDRTVADIINGQLVFNSVGSVEILVCSNDENVEKKITIKYTGGTAVSAVLNVEQNLNVKPNETFEIIVEKWIPSNTIFKTILIVEDFRSEINEVIQISDCILKAVGNGISNISIKLSNKSITFNVKISVASLVQSVKFDKNEIVTGLDNLQLNISVLPNNATNKNLIITTDNEEIAYIQNGRIFFNKAGTVVVTAISEENQEIFDTCTITSTFGYAQSISLNTTEKTLFINEKLTISIKNVLPNDIKISNFNYSIIDFVSNDSNSQQVIELENNIVTAISGGTATIRVFVYDYYGNMVYADCKIIVYVPVQSITLNADEVEYYNNAIITGKNVYSLPVSVYPTDSTNKNLIFESSNTDIATVDSNGVVTFKNAGYVNIKISSNNLNNSNVSVNYLVYCTQNKAINANLNYNGFTFADGFYTKTLNVGEKLNIEITNIIPSDLTDVEINFTYTNADENNCGKIKFVSSVISNKDYIQTYECVSGGVCVLQFTINNFVVGTIKVIIIEKAQSIYVEESNVFVAKPNYQINATVYPTTATYKNLTYECDDINVAVVDSFGLVQFNVLGSVKITITQPDCNITKVITVSYTKNVQKIYTNSVPDVLFNNQSIKITTISYPEDADAFEIEYLSSNTDLLTISQNGILKVTALGSGWVTVTIRVKGNNSISYEKRVFVYYNITNLTLELDAVNDNLGIAGKRVWGTEFVNGNSYINTYQMNILSVYPNVEGIEFSWTSSNPEIATVSNTGLVTVLKPGKVEISVSPLYSNIGLKDSYVFEFVNGINVYNGSDFEKALMKSDDNTEHIVLQGNIYNANPQVVNHSCYVFGSNSTLYGNGYILDTSHFNSGTKVQLDGSNIEIDNIIIVGVSFTEGGKLTDLEGKGILLYVYSYGECLTNISIKNSILRNSGSLIELKNAKMNISGCILENSYSSAISLFDLKNSVTQAEIVIKDCVFGASLAPSISFGAMENSTTTYPQKITIEGQLYMYNWRKLNEVGGDFVNRYVDNAEMALKKILENYPSLKYTYNGEDYYMFGIMQYKAKYTDAITVQSNGKVDVSKISSATNQYKSVKVEGVATMKYSGIALPVEVKLEVNLHTLLNDNTLTSPGSTYDSSIYTKIRQ